MTGRELQRHGFTLAGEFVDTKRSNGLLEFRSQEPVPATRGIYAWVIDDEIVYVGFTDNLHRRVVGEHIRQPRSGRARAELRRALAWISQTREVHRG